MSLVGIRTLVLRSDYMPVSVFPVLSTTPAEEAIQSIVRGAFISLVDYPRKIKTTGRHDIAWPSVIMPIRSHSRRQNLHVGLTRQTLFYRDHGYCQYCGCELTLATKRPESLTFDHVIPTTSGGSNDWENVVAACSPCNHKKGASPPKGRWKPRKVPNKPTYFQLLEERKKFPLEVDDEQWLQFIPPWMSEVRINRHPALMIDEPTFELEDAA